MDENPLMQRDASMITGLEQVSEEQWAFYDDVLVAVRKIGKPFAIGGALAFATYCGYYRNTKDLDLYVPAESKQEFIDAVTKIGASDYYNTLPYDRGWIYRSTLDNCIADLIWAMANYVRPIDQDYFNGETQLALRGYSYAVIPAEELIMNKLYILSRSRCDWFDVFNVLYATNGTLDWDRLIQKLGGDKILLASALRLFAWICPGCVKLFPRDMWKKLDLKLPETTGPEINAQRIASLDSRPWFIPLLKPGEKLFT